MTTVNEPALKTCNFCGETKPADGFRGRRCPGCITQYWREYRARKGDAYREYYREWQRDRRKSNPEVYKATAAKGWLKVMGLTQDEYDALLAGQSGRCAICRRDQPGGNGRWHIDHDHGCCGKNRACKKCIRGLLCLRCNVSIGYMDEDPARLAAAIQYLTRSKGD